MRTSHLLVATALLLVAASGCLSGDDDRDASDEDRFDVLLVNARLWSAGGVPADADAVAVRGDTIVAIGRSDDLVARAVGDARLVDLGGGSLLPGFRDNHAHLVHLAHPEIDPDRGKTGPVTPEMFRPTYTGYDPVRAEAVRTVMFAYHNRVKALEESPMDGCLHSEVTADMKANLLMAQDEALRQGLVSIVEAGLRDIGQFEALLELQEEDRLRLRFLIRFAWGCMEDAHALGYVQGFGGPWVKVQGVKLYSDGWLGPRTAALEAPFSDRPWSDGVLFLEPDRALRDVQRAHDLGYQITTHAIGDRAMRVVLDAYDTAGLTPEDRPMIEHASLFHETLRERFVQQGVIASIQLSFATSDHRWIEDAVGAERAASAYPWRTATDEGVLLAGSSDFYIEALAPLWGIQRTVTRQEVDGTPTGGWHPEEALPLEDALRLLTDRSAFASGEEHERGRIAIGQKADLVAIADDLFARAPSSIASATITLTMVAGQVAFLGAQSYAPDASSLYLHPDRAAGHTHDDDRSLEGHDPEAHPPLWEG